MALATPSSAPSGASAAFVPRTVLAIERAADAIVGRQAAPVRSIGRNLLGFVDRLLGPRLLWAAASASTMGARGSSVPEIGVLPIPWYAMPTQGRNAGNTGIGAAARETPRENRTAQTSTQSFAAEPAK